MVMVARNHQDGNVHGPDGLKDLEKHTARRSWRIEQISGDQHRIHLMLLGKRRDPMNHSQSFAL